MNALEQFKRKAGITAGFGEAQPYVRLSYISDGHASGADADVEFDVDTARVTVTVTEWSAREPGYDRTRIMQIVFDGNGEIVSNDGRTFGDLLGAIDGMTPQEEEKEGR